MTRNAADNIVQDLAFKRVLVIRLSGGAFDCMSALTPDAVISAAQRYLSTESATAPVLASSDTEEEAL
tara:strand:- start:83 stop:286 length:204 start_codon:yes stop_codon:yes gene_type:complete